MTTSFSADVPSDRDAPGPQDDDSPVAAEAALIWGDATSLVEGSSFCASEPSGDIEPDLRDGLFVKDTRVVSTWRLLVDGAPLEALATVPAEPYESTFIGRAAPRPGHDDATIIVTRRRLVGAGMREDITVHNHGTETAGLIVSLDVDADFADLFDVKDGRNGRHAKVRHSAVGSDLVFLLDHAGAQRGVRVTADGATASNRTLSFRVAVPSQESWTTTIEVLPTVAGDELEAAFPIGRPVETTVAARRMQLWRDAAPDFLTADTRLQMALAHSERDLGALRIVDRDHPDDDVVAAGAPWFMALFGRDSLLTGSMAMPVAPRVALGTLRTLARLQGTDVNPMTEEQPGRILHEVRVGMDMALALGGESVYYGSVDSTPLFVMLVDEALRWGATTEQIAPLLPAVDAALDWVRELGDKDGDGFVEYERSTDRGLLHQGWKDSHDAITFADGTPARPPIALAEVQGYVYGAYRARAHLADVFGDPAVGQLWRDRARSLQRAFDAAFWDDRHHRLVLALDRDKRQVDSLASNMGHCLWSGVVLPERATTVADALVSSSMFTGFGIRTLASTMGAYNPVSYHNGAVWPHDTAIAIAGLTRYGLLDHARLVADGLLDAAFAFGGRPPELFSGFDRRVAPFPVPYPAACTPQAWAAASAYQIMRSMIQLEPCVPHGVVHAAPTWPGVGEIHAEGIAIGSSRVVVDADSTTVRLQGLADGLHLTSSTGEPSCAWPCA